MSFSINFTSKFKKDYKKYQNDSKKLREIQKTIILLSQNGTSAIPNKMKPHRLIGNYKDNWECHILNDLLLIWIEDEVNKEIDLVRLGTHSELFK